MMYFLNRFKSDAQGTFGTITDDVGHKYCYTVELPWLDNLADKSCIPEGVYHVDQYNSPKHGDIWMLQNTAPREFVEIHPANDINDLLGCIGVGNAMGIVNGLTAVLNSQSTFKMLKSELPSSFQLTIRKAFL